MFKIGDFSKLCRVPVKTLRYYDEIGLFKAIGVNRYNRYRYYALEQLPELYRILSLKELGFSLAQISQLMSGELTSRQLIKMLLARKEEITGEVQHALSQITQIDARIHQIERDGRLPHREVILKSERAQWVAATSSFLANYDQLDQDVEHLFGQLRGFLETAGLRVTGPPMLIYPEDPEVDEGQRIEVTLPVSLKNPKHFPPSDGHVRFYRLPAIKRLATVIHQGPPATTGDAYGILLEWIQSMEYRQSGPVREVFLRLPEQGIGDPCLLEVQIPVSAIQKEIMRMEPKIISLEAFHVVGMRYFGKNEQNEIGKLWDTFLARLDKIKHIAPGPAVSYGVCTGGEVGETFEYIAALPVTHLADIPAGMVGKSLPAQTYVVMEAHGLDDIGPTYDKIMEEWLPGSGYHPAEGPDFELYPEDMNPDDPNSPIYIYYPIRKG